MAAPLPVAPIPADELAPTDAPAAVAPAAVVPAVLPTADAAAPFVLDAGGLLDPLPAAKLAPASDSVTLKTTVAIAVA